MCAELGLAWATSNMEYEDNISRNFVELWSGRDGKNLYDSLVENF